MTTAELTGVDSAYARCEEITKTEARNFSYGIRLLPEEKRKALSAVYAFARRIDDIGDSTEAPQVRLDGLAEVRAELHALIDGETPDDEVLLALADAAGRMPIPLPAFDEVVDGCEADVRGTRYETIDELLVYCTQVAGSIGRLSLGVFGIGPDTDQAVADKYADDLGLGLQLTNILRDIREDRGNGRVYLPAEDLDRFGVTLDFDADGRSVDDPAKISALIAFEVSRARDYYASGLRLMPLLDRGSAACCGAMAGIYRRVLERIAADPVTSLHRRTSLPVWEKALVAGKAITTARFGSQRSGS